MSTPLPRKRAWSGFLRVLPDFLIIGAQKSGTSSLYQYIIQHPAVAAAYTKEVHYFDLNYRKGVNWYRAYFPTFIHCHMFLRTTGHRLLTGEATPYYLFHPSVPSRVRTILPQVKLIVLLRNPVDRAHSHYHHVVRRHPRLEPLSFEEALEAEARRLESRTEMMLADETYASPNHQHHSYLARGVYVEQLKHWRAFFPAEQTLVLSAEEFFAHPSQTLQSVFTFLKVPPLLIDTQRAFNQGSYHSMARNTRDFLIHYFEPHNQRLFEYLGREFQWDS